MALAPSNTIFQPNDADSSVTTLQRYRGSIGQPIKNVDIAKTNQYANNTVNTVQNNLPVPDQSTQSINDADINKADQYENNIVQGNLPTSGQPPISGSSLAGDIAGARRIRPERATSITSPGQVKDAPTLLAYLHQQGANVSKAKTDPIDSDYIAHFNSDNASGKKIEDILSGLQQQHPDAQIGHIRLANGETSVLFVPAGSEATAAGRSQDNQDNLIDSNEKAVYNEALNKNLQTLHQNKLQLAGLDDHIKAAKDQSQQLQYQADELISQARELQSNNDVLSGPKGEQVVQYNQRQAGKLVTQARVLQNQANTARAGAKEFSNRQKELSTQVDEFGQRIPELAMGEVEQQRAKDKERRDMAQFTNQLHQYAQSTPVLKILSDRRSSLGQINREYDTLLKRKQVEYPVELPTLSNDMDPQRKQQAIQRAQQARQSKINRDPEVQKLLQQKTFYERDIQSLQPAISSMINQNAGKLGINTDQLTQHLKQMGLDVNDPKVQQAIEEELLGAGNGAQ